MARSATNPGRAARVHRRHQPVDGKRGRKIYSPVRARCGAAHSYERVPPGARHVASSAWELRPSDGKPSYLQLKIMSREP
jgi:hypothetical protein